MPSSPAPALRPGRGVRPSAFLLTGEPGGPQPDLLGRLCAAGRAAVIARGRARVFRQGQPVFIQGDRHDGIYLIEQGLVRVFYTAPHGREITLAYWTAGNFVGGPEVFGAATHIWSGTAMRETTVLALSGDDMRDLAERWPALALGLIDGLAFKGTCYSQLAQALGTLSVVERLAAVLHRLVVLHGQATEDGISVLMPYTHDDLASMVGATRQWVSMTLRRFAERGVLRLARKRLLVLQPEWLAAQASGEHLEASPKF